MNEGRCLLDNEDEELETAAKIEAAKIIDWEQILKSHREIEAGQFCSLEDLLKDQKERKTKKES